MGIDPSLTATGITVLENNEPLHMQTLSIKKEGNSLYDETKRLSDIADKIESIAKRFMPDITVMEGLALHARNTTSLTQLAGLNYIVRAKLYGVTNLYIVAPTSLKKYVTSRGNAPKEEVLQTLQDRYNDVTFLDDNVADAFGLALIGSSIMEPKTIITTQQGEVVDLVKRQPQGSSDEE